MLSGKRLPKQNAGPSFASRLLRNESQGFAIDATVENGRVSVKDPTLANNLYNVSLDSSNLTQSGTSPKLVLWNRSPYLRWTPHNMFVNSGTPATQNVTLVTGFVYTVTVTGAGGGNITGSSGASGTATTGSPATFTATGTTGTFTLTGSLDTIQLNRGSIATPYLATGASAKIGIPQEYDTAASKYAILAEPAATNICLSSEDLGTTWSLTGATLTANDTTSPDGSTTADKLNDTDAGSVQFASQNITVTAAQYTASVFMKAGTSSIGYLGFGGGSGDFAVFVDLTNGNTQIRTGIGTPDSVSTVNVGNGWYRVILTGTSNGSSGFLVLAPAGRSDLAAGTLDNAGTGTCYFWGVQLELGSIASSYVPTVGATATRAADVPKALLSTFPWSDTNGSIYMKYKPRVVSSGSRYAWQAYKDANNHISLLGITADPTLENTQASTQDVAIDAGTLVANTLTRVSGAYKANDFDVSQDGAAVQSDAGSTLTTGYTDLYIGTKGSATTEELNGYIYQLLYVPYQRQTVSGDIHTWKNTA